jgi:aspartate racemase
MLGAQGGQMTTNTVGIVGGVGPRATALLYEQVANRGARLMHGDSPRLLVWNLPLRAQTDASMMSAAPARSDLAEVSHLLEDVSRGLTMAGCSAIALPCNTLHAVFRPIASGCCSAWFDMVGSTARAAAARGARIGVLATAATRRSGLYDEALEELSATAVYPAKLEQQAIDRAIRALVRGREPAAGELLEAARSLASEVDVLVVGCTDLSGLVPRVFWSKPVVDSLECLADDIVVHCVEPGLPGAANGECEPPQAGSAGPAVSRHMSSPCHAVESFSHSLEAVEADLRLAARRLSSSASTSAMVALPACTGPTRATVELALRRTADGVAQRGQSSVCLTADEVADAPISNCRARRSSVPVVVIRPTRV